MAIARARRAGSLSGKLLSRRPDRVVLCGSAPEDAGATAADAAGDPAEPARRTPALAQRPAGPLDRTSRTLTLRLDGDRHHALQMASRATGQSQQQLVLAAIDLWLSTRAARPQPVPTRR